MIRGTSGERIFFLLLPFIQDFDYICKNFYRIYEKNREQGSYSHRRIQGLVEISKERIQQSQIKASVQVDSELLHLHWRMRMEKLPNTT